MGEIENWSLNQLRETMRFSNQGRQMSNQPISVRAEKKQMSSRLMLIAAFGAVYLIWGSTYLGIKYAIETLPPLMMAGSRFLVAGAILYVWSLFRGTRRGNRVERPTWAHWRTALAVGGMLFLLGNGGVTWAEHSIASSLAALLVATEPLWIVLFNWSRRGGDKPGGKTMLGLLIGFVGVWLLLTPGGSGAGGVNIIGACVVMGAAFSWAAGSIYSLHAQRPRSPWLASGMQMLAGGAMLIIAGLLAGEWSRFDASKVSARSIVAFVYLILFGSVVAFTAYSWLLHSVSPARAATYAYVNPVVAVILGWALGGEALTLRTIVAATVIVSSVALITSYREKGKLKPAVAAAVDNPGSGDASVVLCAAQRSS
jgi:drug/metabolite transporter (DMT)-like permease